MYHIRKTKTASGATAVQEVQYLDRKLVIVKHVGSGRSEDELKTLKRIASDWITKTTLRHSLFNTFDDPSVKIHPLALLDKCEYRGFRYGFIYEVLTGLMVTSGGFPVAHEIFSGNKFEGHTLIPVIDNFRNKHAISTFTVVIYGNQNRQILAADH